MKITRCALAVLLLIAGVLPAYAAENYTGTYQAPGTNGGPSLTLSIAQAADGSATGELVTAGGANPPYRLRGMLATEGARKGLALVGGMASDNGNQMYFVVDRKDGKVIFSFVPVGDDGSPVFGKATPVTFTPQTGAGGGASTVGGDVVNPNGNKADSGGLTGEFKQGTVTLKLRQEGAAYTGTLSGNGVVYQLEGYPENDGSIFGKLKSEAEGENYFRVQRKDGKLQFVLIKANADGDPNFNDQSTITFDGKAGGGAAPSPSTGGTVATGAGRYAGTFKNDQMLVESKMANGAYTGTIKFAGETFKFNAQEKAGKLEGTFATAHDQFTFSATLNGAMLSLTTEGTNYELKKQGGNPLAQPSKNALANKAPNPLANKGGGAAPTKTGGAALGAGATNGSSATNGGGATNNGGAPAKAGGASAPLRPVADLTANWKTFKHPTGLNMKYPPDWTLKELEIGMQIVPPDAGSNAGGATELYLVSGEPAGGVTSPTDPQVLQKLDGAMGQLAPFLQRAGEGEPARAGTAPGVLYKWTGTNPMGKAVHAHWYVTILKGFAISILALGEKERIASRETKVKAMFGSMGAGAAEKDPRLVGAWSYYWYKSAANGKYGSETKRLMVLRADGTANWQSNNETSMSVEGKNSLGETTFTGGAVGNTNGGKAGSWSAAGGKLFVVWQDGVIGEWNYELNNGRLYLRDGPTAKPDEWSRAQ